MPERREEITKGATCLPLDSDDESKVIKAYLVVDEEDKHGVQAAEINLCEYCHEDPCVWEQHTTSIE
jgi:hypothetical protein